MATPDEIIERARARDAALERAQAELPYCDVCGEEHATCQTEDCGLCDDCFATEARKALRPLMGDICANVSRQPNGYLQVCLAPRGIEHEH